MSLNALAPFQKVQDPTVTAFERSSSEQISKEFKEELEGSQKASLEGVSLDDAPSVSLKREDFLGYGLDSLVKGLSPEALKKKREEEAKQRSKYTSYAGDIFPETPVANLNALEQQDITATQLGDTVTIEDRQMLEDISLTDDSMSLEEGGEQMGPKQENLSWLEEQMQDLQDTFGDINRARKVGSEVESLFDPPERFDAPPGNLAALDYSGPYGAEFASTLSTTGQVMSAYAFDAAKGIYGGMGTQTGLAPYIPPGTGEQIAANVSKYAPYAIKAAALYYTFKGGIPQTTEGKVDAAIATYAIFTGNPVAVAYGAFKGLVSFLKSRRGKPKYAKGGADIAFKNNYFQATSGYGYNGYRTESGQAGAAAVSDYLNTFKDYFGLKFYEPAYKKALAENSRLGRYENINQSGYADASMMIRSIMEIKGFMQGSPKVNGKQIGSQKEYEAAMVQFNEHYRERAMERGGLYDAKKAGIGQELTRDGVPTEIYRTVDTGRPDTSSPIDYYGRHTRNLTSQSKVRDVDNPYDILYYNLVGRFNEGNGGSNY